MSLLPEGPEILSIAGTLGTEVYSTLGLPEVDPELMKIYHAFSHLHGEFRSRLAQALWEAEKEMKEKGISLVRRKQGEYLVLHLPNGELRQTRSNNTDFHSLFD